MSCSGGVYNNEVTMPSASPTEKKSILNAYSTPRGTDHTDAMCVHA